MSQPQIRFSGTLTEEEFIHAAWVSQRPRRSMAALGWLVVLLAAFVSLYVTLSGRVVWWKANMPLAMLVALVLMVRVGHRNSNRAAYRSNAMARAAQTGVASADGISLGSEFGKSEVPWTVFSGARVAEDVVLLYSSLPVYAPIPQSWFASAEEWGEFTGLVKSQLGASERGNTEAVFVGCLWAAVVSVVGLVAVAVLVAQLNGQ